MTDARAPLDPRDTLATCFACGAVPRRSCVACGQLFCERHGGDRLVRRERGIVRRTLCDDCTPNQRSMRTARAVKGVFGAVFLAVFVLFFAFIVSSMATGLDPRSNPFEAFADFAGRVIAGIGAVVAATVGGAVGGIAGVLGVPPVLVLAALVFVIVVAVRGVVARRRTAGELGTVPSRATGERGADHRQASTLTARDEEHGSFEGRLERLVELAADLRPTARYRRLGPPELDLPRETRERLSVYASSDDEGTFLVVPSRYVVTRTDDTAAPALSMVAVLDPEMPRSSQVVFEAALAPDLLPYHLDQVHEAVTAALERARSDDSAALAVGTPSDAPVEPVLHLPSDLPDAPEVGWDDPLTSLASVVRDGDALIVRIVANGIGEAAAVAKRIRPGPEHLGLGGTVRFELGDQRSASASLLVHLGRTVGPAVTTELDPAALDVVLTNRTESRVLLQALRTRSTSGLAATTLPLDPPETLEPGARRTVRVGEGVTQALPLYEVQPGEHGSLSSLRVDVGNLEVVLVVETDLQSAERFETVPGGRAARLTHVRVELDWDEHAPTDVTLARQDDRFAPAVVPLTVPLDRYLEPEQRRLRYRATFAFEDGSHLASAWLEHNYSDTRLTVRRQVLMGVLGPS